MKYIIQTITIVLIAVGVFSCNHSEKQKEKKNGTDSTVYTTAVLQPSHMSSAARLPGVLQPFEFTQLYPKISGFVKMVYVDRGSVVKKGALLLKLEAPEIEEHVSAAKLKYAQAHAMYLNSKDRYMRLLETSNTPGTVSSYDLMTAQTKMQADSATAMGEYTDYKAQQDMYNYLSVTAPFDGVITERNVHPGALVGPGAQGSKPMLVLQQQSKLRLVINVPEAFSSQLAKQDEVHFTVNAIPQKIFTGKIARSSNSLNDNYRSEAIEVDVDNTDNVFKPGMYAEVTLPVSANVNAFIVPKSAVVTTTERKYLIAENNNRTKWVDITAGNASGDSVEVFGALEKGGAFIVNASYQIKNGVQVNTK